jgi:tetratricopeptide (TPR) repeat protein
MSGIHSRLKHTVATFLVTVMFSLPAAAETERVETLLSDLARADAQEASTIVREIRLEWSKSGSPAMDLLLKRGLDALEIGNVPLAIDHLTALTDHAPDFAEGWNTLALAYYRAELLGPAVYALERTLALNPRHFSAIKGLGAVFEQVGEPEKAFAAYRKVLDIYPHDPEVLEAVERLELQVTGQEI